ncbi:MAG: lytic transglycosylase domain-containing protein [Oligoflexales bacterium]|nr:lytic transglycosylase domain-containing protein [Oligoflexales bacterium]
MMLSTQRRSLRLVSFGLILSLLACRTQHGTPSSSEFSSKELKKEVSSGPDVLLTIPHDLETVLSHSSSSYNVLEFEKMANNRLVRKWIDYFTGDGRESFQQFLYRGSYYRPVIQYILKKHDLPVHLYYLAMIESGFQLKAVSSAKAVGIWQFMRPTAGRYHLRVDRYVDERKDPIRATLAACQYLKDLHNVFGSWYLAIAAYNAGETRIMNVIMRSKTRDYWDLVELGALPRETIDYAPQFVAAALIGEHAEKYGFKLQKSDAVLPALAAIKIPPQTSLHRVASVLDLPISDLKRFNPHVQSEHTPPYGQHYFLWIPAEKKEKAKDLSKLKRTFLSTIAGLSAEQQLY